MQNYPNQAITSLLAKFRKQKLKLALAESCTGGLVAATITQIPGVSDIFERGFITYSNKSKIEMLGVSEELIKKYGSVSAEVAEEMAKGALKYSRADASISITGIAGPDGGSEKKPVGLVYIGVADKTRSRVIKNNMSGTRAQIQQEALERAIKLLNEFIK